MTQATEAPAKTPAQITERTPRGDPWRRAPAVTALLSIWAAFATVRVLAGHLVPRARLPLPDPVLLTVRQRRVRAGNGRPGHWLPAVPPVIPYAPASPPLALGFRPSRLPAGAPPAGSGAFRASGPRPGPGEGPWLDGGHAQPARGAPGGLMPAGLHIMPAAGGAAGDLTFPNQIPS